MLCVSLVAAALAAAACGDEFSGEECRETRTCKPSAQGGSAEEAAHSDGGSALSNGGGNAGSADYAEADAGSGGMPQLADPCGDPGAACCEADDCRGGSSCVDGTCQCANEEQACGGACIDVSSDAANCGTCGHDCLGGECANGVCQPLELAQNQGTFLQLALDGDYVYWSGDTAVIGRARIDGSEPAEELVPVAANEHGYEIVAIGQTLYWGNDWQDNGIRGCALPACAPPMTLIAGTTPIYGLLYDRHSERLFWNQSNVIWSKPLPAGSSQVFFTADKSVQDLATDADFLYWAELDVDTQTSKIRKRRLDGGDAALLGGNIRSASNLTVFRDALYFIGPGGTLHALPLPNGIGNAASEQFAPSVAVKSAVADRDGIFWVQRDTSTDGTVRWCPHEGCTGQPEIRATVPDPWSIVSDEMSIYWSSGTGSIFRLAK